MRDWSVRLACLFSLVAASAAPMLQGCQATPGIIVVRTSPGDKATQDLKGDPVKLKRGAQEAYAGARGGYFVVRNGDDWDRAFPNDKGPAFPTLDTASQMILMTVAESKAVTQTKIVRAIETAELVYVWVRETKVGEGCTNKAPEAAFDAVVAQRADKPIKFLVEEERGEGCGLPPTASVQCRQKKADTWSPKIAAQPGDTVECEMNAAVRGKFELVDKILSVDLPAGSAAKLRFAKGPQRGELEVDVYGTYAIQAEATDEGGRHGKATATVDVKPPTTKDVLVQLVWAGFEVKDESDTFPRVNLRVAEEGPRGQRCSAEIPIPGLCEVKTRGAYTYMRIPAGSRKLPVSIQYMDDRPEKGPGPCVHVWFDGARTGETCDRKARTTDEIWKVGTLDTTTGQLMQDGVALGAPAAPAAPDAGAPAPQKK